MSTSRARIPIKPETRDALAQLKVGDMTWDDLFRDMAKDYEPREPGFSLEEQTQENG